ncbi:RHS repeat-associated core domain-containing protein [Chryseobacterium sp. JJR-5R]|uniref:RHS repeat-associated core domain-containing protein n=1 Tax=Chryseobacterium sp. JJR-5R TaxID=3093923 RepID=UPI002A74CC04|nr:RHS repeat-associated core domain-containing protein [Chryseobacterium sp. JJR-5R]WPO81568.1 RHS repeat-associated core domain-containing protein [Chryseobacterium sp. JJR-5R]
MAEQMTGTYDNPYKFNAKELDAETGFYYYGARYYNPKWSQWYGVDPLAEKMPSWSPYVYTFDNPVNFVDPDGREPIGPGDPRSVQVYGYTVVRSASGWSVHRNLQMDKSITRIEGKNWTGQKNHILRFLTAAIKLLMKIMNSLLYFILNITNLRKSV